MIAAGALRHIVKIQEPVLAEDSYSAGSAITSWNDIYTGVRASINPLRGTELFESLKLEGEISHRIRIRYISGITPKHRIKWDERVFNIRSIVNDRELNRVLDIFCTEEI